MTSNLLTVACVLKTGRRFVDKERYTLDHVDKLHRSVRENLTFPHRFVCLSDVEIPVPGVDRVALRQDWPGWWSKIELFRPGLFTGSVLFFDLDTLIVGNIDELVRWQPGMTMVADFGNRSMMNSSTMAWTGDYGFVHDRFAHDPDGLMAEYDRKRGPTIGDQGFIHKTLRDNKCKIGTFSPERVVSFKWEAKDGAPKGASVVSFHGTPKLDQPGSGWAYEQWSAI